MFLIFCSFLLVLGILVFNSTIIIIVCFVSSDAIKVGQDTYVTSASRLLTADTGPVGTTNLTRVNVKTVGAVRFATKVKIH